MKTPREIVLKYHPDATAKNVGCKKGDYFHIYNGNDKLGEGKSSKMAWKAAYKHLDD